MQQRRLRPGDVLDDYCPRERRITEHAIVAMIDDDIKQTRCVACDTEHEYKQARVPARKKKAPAGLFDQVLDGLQGSAARVALPASAPVAVAPSPPDDDLDPPAEPPPVADTPVAPMALAEALPLAPDPLADPRFEPVTDDLPIAAAPAADEVPFRRSLIRAQLPRIEGHVPARTLPEFTIRQPQNGRAGRPGGHGRRRPSQPAEFQGPMRSGRSAHGQGGFGQGQGGHGQGQGRGRGPSPQGGRPDRQGGAQGQRSGRGRRGKKH